jgi:hypothetical protein
MKGVQLSNPNRKRALKNSLRIVVVLLSAFVGFPNATSAQTTPAAMKMSQAILSTMKENPGAADRTELSKALLEYCTDLLRRTPRNSPRENDWVSGDDINRMARAHESVENSRWSVTKTFTLVRIFLSPDLLQQLAARSGLCSQSTCDAELHPVKMFSLHLLDVGVLPLLQA